METVEVPQPTWIDQTFRVAENAEVEVDLQPNGSIEYSVTIPECPSARLTVILPPAIARKVHEKVRELIAAAPIALVIIGG